MQERIVVLTGAGISAESGIQTFRGADGLWNGHNIMDVATPEGWEKNRTLVLEFYNRRRRQLQKVNPNAAHLALAELERKYEVHVITQNVDDLHERAGSTNIIHLHGELLKVRSEQDPSLVYHWPGDLELGDTCEKGHQLRPHVVWFGEEVPMLPLAAELTAQANTIIVVGSSMQVYPAAGLVGYARKDASILYIDKFPTLNTELQQAQSVRIIHNKATIGVPEVVSELLS